LTLTEGSTEAEYTSLPATTSAFGGADVHGNVGLKCSLAGTTAAVCTETAEVTANDRSTATAVTTSLSSANYVRYDVAITAGAEKTASATATCANAGSSLSGKKTALFAMAGVFGVSGLLAMM
jgi:hypothetical protein